MISLCGMRCWPGKIICDCRAVEKNVLRDCGRGREAAKKRVLRRGARRRRGHREDLLKKQESTD
jgi:hypothetical protein